MGFLRFFIGKTMVYNFFNKMWLLLCIHKKKSILLWNKSKFVLLVRVLSIISIILLLATSSNAQDSRRNDPGGAQKILKLYPNPAITFIKFEFQKNYENGFTLQVINFVGKQLYEAKNISSNTTLDLSGYSRGVYIYQLRDVSGKVVESGKFQVSK